MMRAFPYAVFAAVALLAPACGAAQLRVIPQVGLYTPFTDLPSPSAGAEDLRKGATLAYSLAVELGTPDAVSFRINLLHATDSEIPIEDVGCQVDCARSTVSAATATLALRPIPALIAVQPFLLLGGGVKRYDFTRSSLQDEGLSSVPSDRNQLTGHPGAGAELNLGLIRITGEISDVLSRFDTEEDPDTDAELQHDTFLTVGIVLGG